MVSWILYKDKSPLTSPSPQSQCLLLTPPDTISYTSLVELLETTGSFNQSLTSQKQLTLNRLRRLGENICKLSPLNLDR